MREAWWAGAQQLHTELEKSLKVFLEVCQEKGIEPCPGRQRSPAERLLEGQ